MLNIKFKINKLYGNNLCIINNQWIGANKRKLKISYHNASEGQKTLDIL